MDYTVFRRLEDRLCFSVEDIVSLTGIKPDSARVLCSRYRKKGIFIRLKKNLYVLEEKWRHLEREDFLRIANFLQVPSYVSFLTALSVRGITTQVPRGFFESASLKRSVKFEAKDTVFAFYKLKKGLYFDFVKEKGYFIATKEKAFLDAVYLSSLGRYALDFTALDTDRLDKTRLKKLIKAYPQKTKIIARRICRI
jgi:predicted transcriptional regulator of viral defense system